MTVRPILDRVGGYPNEGTEGHMRARARQGMISGQGQGEGTDPAADGHDGRAGGSGHRHGALAHSPEERERVAARLKRIEGQVRGLHRMVDEGRYCPEILTQIASVHAALRGVGKVLMREHLQHCVTDALRSGDPMAAERTYDEVMDLMYRHVRE